MQVNKNVTELEAASKNKEYEVKAIWDSTIYANEAEDHLPGLYYLVA